jgi:tetratricopeptide (TPR) repeat protein
MRTNLIRGVLALAVIFAVSAPALAQSIVRGKVTDAQGKPVEGATVTIAGTEGSTRKAEVKTNNKGEFLQVGLPSGRYSVTAAKDKLQAVAPANVTQGRPVELSLQLTATSGMSPEQAKEQAETQALAQGAIDAMRAGRDDEAIQKFNEITAKIPTCSDCYYNLGLAYTKKGQFTEAETAFKRVIELKPDSADAYTGLANLYNSQKKFDLAAAASTKAQELSGAAGTGGSAEATYNQGVILWNGGKYKEAKEQFEAAVKADPNMAMAQYQLGMANLNLGLIPDARVAFEGYLKADPDGPKAAEVKTFLAQLPK